MCFFFFIHSFACIMPGRCSSAGLLPRQHQDPHDCAVWVLASYGSREQELFSIIYCCTKLFVCFFNFQTRQNAEEQAPTFGSNDFVVSIGNPEQAELHFPCPSLHLHFFDKEDDRCITEEQADALAAFVRKEIGLGRHHFIVHCNQGISRSAGAAAAFLRAFGFDEGIILDDGRYCINGWCYLQVCRAFGLKVSEEEATAARLRSRRAYLLTWSVVGNDEEAADSEDAITDADFM